MNIPCKNLKKRFFCIELSKKKKEAKAFCEYEIYLSNRKNSKFIIEVLNLVLKISQIQSPNFYSKAKSWGNDHIRKL